MSLLGFTGFVLASIICGLVIWVLRINYKSSPVTTYDTKFVNLMPQYSDSYAKGDVINTIFGDKRIGIEFMPTDINYKKLKLGKKLVVKPQRVWLKHKITFNKGDLSANQTEIWGLPQDAAGFSNQFKQTLVGQSMMKIVEEANHSTDVETVMSSRMDSLVKLAKQTAGNEIIDDFSEKIQEINKDISKLSGKEKAPTFGSKSIQ